MQYQKQICKQCQKPFSVLVKEIKRGNGKFCSIGCRNKFYFTKPKEPNVRCAMCSKSFYIKPYRLKVSKSGLVFCCRKCKDRAQRLIGGLTDIQPSHYGSGNRIKYRVLAFEHYPHKCNCCGYDNNVDILEVHHIDNNHNNNDVSNLEILCPNCHTIIHK